MAALSDWKTEHPVIYFDMAPFQFSGELDPESGHLREYVLDAWISSPPHCFGAMQCTYSAIQRVGHPGLAPEKCVGARILAAENEMLAALTVRTRSRFTARPAHSGS